MLKNLLLGTTGLWAMAHMAPSDEPLEIVELEVNLADAKKPPEIPAGKVPAEVQDIEVKTSNTSGNKYYAIKFVVDPLDLPEEMREIYDDGAPIYFNRQVVPKNGQDRRAIFNLKQLYTNLGLDNNLTTIDPNDWMGCKTLLTIRHKAYEGEMRAEIASMAPLDKAPARTTRQAAAAPKRTVTAKEEAKPAAVRGRRK